MPTADSKTNSIDDEERHYIGNLLLDDDGPTVNHAIQSVSFGYHHRQANHQPLQHSCQQPHQQHCNNNHQNGIGHHVGGGGGPAVVSHSYSKAVGGVVSGGFAPPLPPAAQQQQLAQAAGRGRKSYRDVASINRSGSSAVFNYANIVHSEATDVSASCESLTLLKHPALLRPRYSKSYYQHPPPPVPAFAKLNGRPAVGQPSFVQPPAVVTANGVKSKTIPGLNQSSGYSTVMTNGTVTTTTFNGKPMAAVKGMARKQKSATDFQRVGGKRSSPNLSVAVEPKPPVVKGSSVPATPASHSPPINDWTASTKSTTNQAKTNWKKSDEFINVSYGNGSAKSRTATAADDVSAKPTDAKSRYEVLKKIGSISAPDYENVLSAMREASGNDRRRRGSDDNTTTGSKRSTTTTITSASDRGRSMSIQDVEFSHSSQRSNGKTSANGQKERSRAKTNGVLRNGAVGDSTATSDVAVGPTGGFWNAFRYFLFAVASAFAGDGRRDAAADYGEGSVAAGWLMDGPAGAGQLQPLVARLFAAAAGGGPAFSGHSHAHRSGSTTSSTANGSVGSHSSMSGRRKSRKNNQKHDTFLKCLHIYSTTLWRMASAAVLWIINLLVNFIVLLSLAIVVVFRQILSCF